MLINSPQIHHQYLATAGLHAIASKPSLEEAFARVCPENDLERTILENPEWREGASLGKPRPGHPEGQIIYHILEVLANVDEWCAEHGTSSEDRSKLRAIAMIHDTFKHKVDRRIPEEGENHHAAIARRFGESIAIADSEMLSIIEHHDDAYLIWRAGNQTQDWPKAEKEIRELDFVLKNEGARVDLYRAFYWCDNRTGDKEPTPVIWFNSQI